MAAQGASAGQEGVWSTSPTINNEFSSQVLSANVQVGPEHSFTTSPFLDSVRQLLAANASHHFPFSNGMRRLEKRISTLMGSPMSSPLSPTCRATNQCTVSRRWSSSPIALT